MGHTNSTANLSLPQFIGTDKPTWLGDVNGAFSAIDSYVGTNDAAVSAAASDASSAISQAAAAVNTANTANTTAGNASTAATAAVTAANQANALSNQIALRTGVLADLHTTDRTSIVNAINEVKDAEGDLSSLTTTDKTSLVNAINEIEAAVSGNDEVSYNATGITYSAALDALYAACDTTKITANSKIVIDNQIVLQADNIVGPYYEFSRASGNATSITNVIVIFMSSGSTYGNSTVNNTPSFTHTDLSSTTVTGTVNFKLIY